MEELISGGGFGWIGPVIFAIGLVLLASRKPKKEERKQQKQTGQMPRQRHKGRRADLDRCPVCGQWWPEE